MKLTKDDVRQIVARLGCTQVGLGRVLGVSDVTSRRWVIYGATGMAAILLHVIDRQQITLENLRAMELFKGRATLRQRPAYDPGHLTAAEADENRPARLRGHNR